VREHQAAGVQLGLQVPAVDAGLRRDRQRHLVDLDDLVKRGEIDHDAAMHRQAAALGPGAPAPRHDRDAVLVGEPHDLRDLLLGTRAHDDVGPGDRGAGRRGVERRPVGVGDVRVQAIGGRRDGVAQRADERLLHVGQGGGRRGRHRGRWPVPAEEPGRLFVPASEAGWVLPNPAIT
jgi:hypothetical protein